MGIENRIDAVFVGTLALREKQIQQSYRPIIAVHKWFARRPGSLFRSLLLSEFVDDDLGTAYYKSHDLENITIADPFMGGGTPLFEANRMGCDVIGCDVNPMSYWIVREELESLDVEDYREAAEQLRCELRNRVGNLYQTRCVECGSTAALVKYFLWVKRMTCPLCGYEFDLFPSYVVAKPARHPKWVVVCSECGRVNEVDDPQSAVCTKCSAKLNVEGPARRQRCKCPNCGSLLNYPGDIKKPLPHRMFAIEYYCPDCEATHRGRFYKTPDDDDISNYRTAVESLTGLSSRYIPDDEITAGDESSRLLLWGYRTFRELFNERQLLGLHHSAEIIHSVEQPRIRRALATNLSDLVRYQNMLCRYDTWALKSLDVFSVHGFPVGLVQCESNLLGIYNSRKQPVGSGGWTNIVEKYAKAKEYCEAPFEVKVDGSRRSKIPIRNEWIGEHRKDSRSRRVDIGCCDARKAKFAPESVDAVLTDPPYFGNVQYGELMQLCYVWLRRLGDMGPSEDRPSIRDTHELTGNRTAGRGLDFFAEGLSTAFQQAAVGLKAQGVFVFTYHHNHISAYFPIALAILDAGLHCTQVFPCPAEMGGSIHIKNTRSSVVDSVFVCRKHVADYQSSASSDVVDLITHVVRDLHILTATGLTPSTGDTLCVTYGQLAKGVVNALRPDWNAAKPIAERLSMIADEFASLADPNDIAQTALEAVTDES